MLNEMRIRWLSTVSALCSVSVSCSLLAQAWSLAELGLLTVSPAMAQWTYCSLGSERATQREFACGFIGAFPQSAWPSLFLSPITATFGFPDPTPWSTIKRYCVFVSAGRVLLYSRCCILIYAKIAVTPSGDRKLVRCDNIGGGRIQKGCKWFIFIIS